MELSQLVKEAYEKDSTFKFKFDYWCHTRKKQPDLDWLMPLLENALGKQYVKQAAQEYIDGQERES